jgi:dihydrodipicolinate synthase/N-acetylneuraminate lyase
MKKYSGIIVPAVTPLTEKYKLDKDSVEKLFDHYHQYNCHPFILGTTGECSSLSWELKQKYVKRAARIKKQGTLLYVGISSNCFEESVEFAKFSLDQGADVLVSNLPSYYPLTDDQMKKYFTDLVEAVDAPMVIYNIPSTTHMSIPLSIIDELSHHPNIIATKDSERNEERLQQSLTLWKDRKDFSHFLGWAARSVAALFSGTDGLVPATANLIPEVYANMLAAVAENNRQKAYELQEQSDNYGNLYQSNRTLGQSLHALKVLLEQKQLCQSYVMPPL